ncbi:MAG: hypothetical protein ACQGVC_03850, partial [Myxococcota bacterium]
MVLPGVPQTRNAVSHTQKGHSKRARRRRLGALTTPLLDLVALKPIAIFVWWFSQRGNRIVFARRRELRSRISRALASGRPVVLASNHVSWFDDPVIPMVLYRTGEQALAEVAGL